MAKVMIPREEYLRRQGLLEEDNTCCGGGVPKLVWIALVFAAIAAGISFLSNKED